MSLLPVDDAIAAILKRVPPTRTETVALADGAGRVLTRPIIARHDQPPFDASAMDGYALRAADVVDGQALKLVGTSQAGLAHDGTVHAGEAVRIFTGAPLPAGTDTVIMQEEAEVDDGFVRFSAPARLGHSVRPLGNDFKRGQVLVEAGTRLSPMQLAVAAAANMDRLDVARRPRVSLLATGDELVLPGQALGASQIVASNSYGLRPMILPYAAEVIDHGIARDTRADLAGRLEAIFAGEPDIVITTGGASVGDHDIVQDILGELGVTLDFWKINMRPGKPLMFGTHGQTLVFGLPGNPVSAMVTAMVFIRPALRQWLGYPEPAPWHLPLAGPTPANTARRHYMRAQLLQTPTGPQLLPVAQTDSGHTSSLAQADMLILQPEHDPGQPAGAIVGAIPLDAF